MIFYLQNYKHFCKYILIVVLAIFTNSCNKPTFEVLKEEVIYKSDTIRLYEITHDEIECLFGPSKDTIAWGDYSYEILYRNKSISFSYKQSDSLKTVNWANAKTRKNRIIINGDIELSKKPSVDEIVNYFGIGQWSYDNSYTGLSIEYDDFDFVVDILPEDKFYLESINENDWPTTFERFKYHIVSQIDVY